MAPVAVQFGCGVVDHHAFELAGIDAVCRDMNQAFRGQNLAVLDETFLQFS